MTLWTYYVEYPKFHYVKQPQVLAVKESAVRKNLGTMDGISDKGSVVEIKTANSNSFRRVMQFGPLGGHAEQVGTYVLTSGAERGIMLYENKDTQEFKEIVLEREDLPLAEIAQRAEQIWDSIANRKLAEPLPQVYESKFPCATCPFRDVCPKIKNWDQAEEIADEFRSGR